MRHQRRVFGRFGVATPAGVFEGLLTVVVVNVLTQNSRPELQALSLLPKEAR